MNSYRFFDSIDEIIATARRNGSHFFDRDTMRFFKSRIAPGLFAGRFFVTSEQGPNNVRRYTVRVAAADGSIDEIGAFQAHATLRSARAAIRAHAATLPRWCVAQARIKANSFHGCFPTVDEFETSEAAILSIGHRGPDATWGLFERQATGALLNVGWYRDGTPV